MIFVSTACLKHPSPIDSVRELADSGIGNIELSGGRSHEPEMEEKLRDLKERYGLNYTLHNYFPPPPRPFVLNLASLDDHTYGASLKHFSSAIAMARRLGITKAGIHAGYLVELENHEMGGRIARKKVSRRAKALKRFCEAIETLQVEAGPDLALYIENNVYSRHNASVFGGNLPFLLLTYDDFEELTSRLSFKLLVDIAHLKTTAQTLRFDFGRQVRNMTGVSDYLHVSDNDGSDDTHGLVEEGSAMHELLNTLELATKTVTIESKGSIKEIQGQVEILRKAESGGSGCGGKMRIGASGG